MAFDIHSNCSTYSGSLPSNQTSIGLPQDGSCPHVILFDPLLLWYLFYGKVSSSIKVFSLFLITLLIFTTLYKYTWKKVHILVIHIYCTLLCTTSTLIYCNRLRDWLFSEHTCISIIIYPFGYYFTNIFYMCDTFRLF